MAESSQNTGTMSDSLSRIPDNISLKCLPDQEKLSCKLLQKGLNYFAQGYLHEIKVLEFENKIHVEARCWPSMKKNQPPQPSQKLSLLTKYLRETTQITQDCGNTSVTRASPVCLANEFRPLNENTECINPCDTEVRTRNQTLSDHWFHERKNRLRASNLGKVISRKSKPSEKFINSLFSKNDVNTKALEYGERHEKTSKEKYLELYPSRHFHECGFVVKNDFSFLVASPDGKLCDNGVCGIVEIKCPFPARKMTIEKACSDIPDFYLQKDEHVSLKKTLSYYAQIQGQLMATGCEFCEFIVYTQEDMYVERIKPDIPSMTSMLQKLAEFYRDYAIPYLQSSK